MKTKSTHKKISTRRPRARIASSGKRGLGTIDPTGTGKLYVEGGLFLLKAIVIGGAAYWVYRKFVNRFEKLPYNTKYPAANISDGEAETRANGIYSGITMFGNSVQNAAANLQGLNYNGFVKVYNAFGKRPGTLLAGDLNLVEWLNNQFDETEMEALRFLVPGLF